MLSRDKERQSMQQYLFTGHGERRVEPLLESVDRREDAGQQEVQQRPQFGQLILKYIAKSWGLDLRAIRQATFRCKNKLVIETNQCSLVLAHYDGYHWCCFLVYYESVIIGRLIQAHNDTANTVMTRAHSTPVFTA